MPPQKKRRRQATVHSFFTRTSPSALPSPPTPPSPPSTPSSPPPRPLQTYVLGGLCVAPRASPRAFCTPFAGLSLPPPPRAPPACDSPLTPRAPDDTPPDPPTPSSRAPSVPSPAPPSESSDEQPSRLSRARNIARRSARLAAEAARRVEECVPAVVEVAEGALGETREERGAVSDFGEVVETCGTERHTGNEIAREPTDSAPSTKPRKLHPFFAATAAAVNQARERVKRPRVVVPLVDAWEHAGATVHVNCVPPAYPFCDGVVAAAGRPVTLERVPETTRNVCFHYYSSTAPLESDVETRVLVSEHPCESADAWAERYKRDRRIDVINGAATKELVDWLRDWYETPDATPSSEAESDDSTDSFVMPPCPVDRERVAIITGPVGCGKSTVVANAAHQLGLSILEINSSVCRTGKRVREIIGEALSTHRVAHHKSIFDKFAGSGAVDIRAATAKTLILFEEVDELQDDEKGFWATIQKLAASSDCRRPIVCTANTFTAQMRQFFMEPQGVIQSDLDRLLVHTKVDQIVNPVDYKHIKFQSRSERQAAAVIKRVSASESTETLFDMTDCLALTCGDDTRRAINLLHFWGSRGLSLEKVSVLPSESWMLLTGTIPEETSKERLGNVGVDVIQVALQTHMAPSIFRVGSVNYAKKQEESNVATLKETGVRSNDDVLETWCASLESMSYSDAIQGTLRRERERRNRDSSEEPEDICMHADVEDVDYTAEQLDMEALYTAMPFLMFGQTDHSLRDIARSTLEGAAIIHDNLPQDLPLPRRPILAEYLPILKTMALSDEMNSTRSSLQGQRHDLPLRRTRARSRQSGFCVLGLDPVTVLTLKRTSTRPK